VTEDEWQQQLIELAHILGWKHMHVRRSIGKGRKWVTATNVIGWPDLVMWSERQKRLIFAELKSESGKTSPEQDDVIASLRAAGQEVYVWRPSDLDEALRILKGAA
jgi:hypothetical protein